VFCTHDPVEFVAMAVWQGNLPVAASDDNGARVFGVA
jgi:hypothetical protein